MNNGQPHSLSPLEAAAHVKRVERLAETVLKVLEGERIDVAVMVCLQAAVSMCRQEATAAGTKSDAVSATDKLIYVLTTIREAERVVVATRKVQQ